MAYFPGLIQIVTKLEVQWEYKYDWCNEWLEFFSKLESIFRKNLHSYNLIENKSNFNSVIHYHDIRGKKLNSSGVSEHLIIIGKSNNWIKQQEGSVLRESLSCPSFAQLRSFFMVFHLCSQNLVLCVINVIGHKHDYV